MVLLLLIKAKITNKQTNRKQQQQTQKTLE